MKINRRTFIKRMNRTLAGVIGMLGFIGCEKESGANYTVMGSVVNKANINPIEGIRVGYGWAGKPAFMYGPLPATHYSKASVLTNAKGEFILTDRFRDEEFQMVDNNMTLPISVCDAENGLFKTEYLQVEFPGGKNTVIKNVELTEIKSESDE